MTFQECEEKILMSLVGKSIGGILGARIENQKQWREIPDIEARWPEKLPPNDDLDIQILWLEALQEHGPKLTGKILAEIWQDRCFYYFCEYGSFLYNVQRGLMPPLSGKWGNEFFLESNGCPIRAEIWGLVTPGMPALADEYAKLDASLDHDIYGASTHLERFWAVATSLAMVMDDRDAILKEAAKRLPSGSKVREAFDEIPALCADSSLSDKQVWRRLVRAYGDADASKALINFAICLFALYRGGEDLKKVMTLCLNSGWDVDCTAAACAAFLCLLRGRSVIPQGWMEKAGANLLCAINVKHKRSSLVEVASDIARCCVEVMLSRDPSFKMDGMPALNLRRSAPPSAEAEVRYEGSPVLRRSKPSRFVLTLRNNSIEPLSLELSLEAPAHCVASLHEKRIELLPGASCELPAEASLRDPSGPLPDKNLFRFRYGSETLVFGLAGVRTWKIYGPYWEMWDSKKYPECPFDNEKVSCMPGALPGFMGDSYVQYARLDKEYLDERCLIEGRDLPEEDPFVFEAETDFVDSRKFAGFTGAACYYLVRDLRHDGDLSGSSFRFAVGRGGPCKVWFDGKELVSKESVISWSQHSDEGRTKDVKWTGKPQRLVVKIARQANEMAFSVSPLRDPDAVKGISWFDDMTSDLL